jgi:hypothetical protein
MMTYHFSVTASLPLHVLRLSFRISLSQRRSFPTHGRRRSISHAASGELGMYR